MKIYFLDEDINIRVQVPEQLPSQQLVAYSVYRRAAGDRVLLFNGQAFCEDPLDPHITVRVNDIIQADKWVNEWDSVNKSNGVFNWIGLYQIEAIVEQSVSTLNIAVANIFRYPRTIVNPSLTWSDDPFFTGDYGDVVGFGPLLSGYNFDTELTDLLPRVPRIASDNFIIPFLLLNGEKDLEYSRYLQGDEREAGDGVVLTDEGPVMEVQVPLSKLIIPGTTTPSNTIDIHLARDGRFIPVAQIDSCTADFYLVWQDRYGSFQSQPFNGTATYSHSYEHTTITDYNRTQRKVGVNVSPKYLINSGYLDFKTIAYYEGIFVSPYLKLYDVKNDLFVDVIVTDTEYTEKTFMNNSRQLYNLQLNLDVTEPQNIIY